VGPLSYPVGPGSADQCQRTFVRIDAAIWPSGIGTSGIRLYPAGIKSYGRPPRGRRSRRQSLRHRWSRSRVGGPSLGEFLSLSGGDARLQRCSLSAWRGRPRCGWRLEWRRVIDPKDAGKRADASPDQTAIFGLGSAIGFACHALHSLAVHHFNLPRPYAISLFSRRACRASVTPGRRTASISDKTRE
jgi:hypothetical protein